MENPTEKINNGAGSCDPPKDTRFKPGQSGNPKGRPKKGRKNFISILGEQLAQPTEINVKGKNKKVRKIEAVAMVCVQKAMQGDFKFFNKLSRYAEQIGEEEEAKATQASEGLKNLSKDERNRLRELLEKLYH